MTDREKNERRAALALMASEAHALRSIRGVVRLATTAMVARAATKTLTPTDVFLHATGVASELERDVTLTVQAARAEAATSGVTALRRQAKALGVVMPVAAPVLPGGHPYRDAGRAAVAGKTTSASWLQTTMAKAAEAVDATRLPRVLHQVHALVDGRLRRLAATESAEAFNAAREAEFQALAERAPGLIQRWVAVLDRRTCPTCDAMHGRTAPMGAEFSAGSPPVHNYCRCFVVLDVASPFRKAA